MTSSRQMPLLSPKKMRLSDRPVSSITTNELFNECRKRKRNRWSMISIVIFFSNIYTFEANTGAIIFLFSLSQRKWPTINENLSKLQPFSLKCKPRNSNGLASMMLWRINGNFIHTPFHHLFYNIDRAYIDPYLWSTRIALKYCNTELIP